MGRVALPFELGVQSQQNFRALLRAINGNLDHTNLVSDAASLSQVSAGKLIVAADGNLQATVPIEKALGRFAVANVLDYGAKGDGATNDSAAIQSAINSGNIVVFPPGTYLCNAMLTATAPVRLVGSQGRSVLSFASGLATCISISQVASPGARAPRIQVEDLTLAYAGSGTLLLMDQSGIATPYPDTLIRACTFDLSGGAGVAYQSKNQRQVQVRECYFVGSNGGIGIQLNDSSNPTIIGNVFFQLGTAIQGALGPSLTFDAGAQIIGNDIVTMAVGLDFDNWQLVQAVGNLIDYCDLPVKFVDCYDSIVADNWIAGTGLHNLVSVTLSGTKAYGHINIRGNRVHNYRNKAPSNVGTNDGTANIAIAGSGAYNIDHCTVAGNDNDEYYLYGVYLNKVTNSLVSGNVIAGTSSGQAGHKAIYDATAASNAIIGNELGDGVTATGDVVANNPGYTTRAYGYVTLGASATSVAVSMSLATGPSNVQVTPGANVGDVWVSGVGQAGFTINVTTAPGAATLMFWEAEV